MNTHYLLILIMLIIITVKYQIPDALKKFLLSLTIF